MFCTTNVIYYVLLRQAEFEPRTSPLPSKTTSSKVKKILMFNGCRLLRWSCLKTISSGAPYVTLHNKLDEEK
jgi:hypothetical protein